MAQADGTGAAHQGGRPRVLLLQGPAGPFFRDLGAALSARGLSSAHLTFHAGDRLFAGRGAAAFPGGENWPGRLRWFLDRQPPGLIILFGSERPVHRVARSFAAERDIPVLALEEGYIRPGYVTAEAGGNNAASPLAGRAPVTASQNGPLPFTGASATPAMCLWSAAYYATRTLAARRGERPLFHRRIHPAREIFCWARNPARWALYRRRDARAIRALTGGGGPGFFLVALQCAGDANLGAAALGWSGERLIVTSIAAFARAAPPDARLVFKVHPMDRGHFRLAPLLRSVARANGVADRITLLHAGRLADLTPRAAGMVTINSGAGLSALHHDIPLMVIGRAVYAHPALATCGEGMPDLDRFFRAPLRGNPERRAAFLARLRAKALVPGDFYTAKGRRHVAVGIADRAVAMLAASHAEHERQRA